MGWVQVPYVLLGSNASGWLVHQRLREQTGQCCWWVVSHEAKPLFGFVLLLAPHCQIAFQHQIAHEQS